MKKSAYVMLIFTLSLLPIFTTASGQPESKGLVINEFMADNDGAVPGPYMTFPDWIELYNGGDTPIDLSGMILSEDLASPPWRFPNGTILGPGEFLIVWGNRGSGPDMLHTNFSPNAKGGTLTLLAADGTTVIDQITFKKQIRDVSYGRIPDGGSTWWYLINPTPGKPNIANPQTGILTNWAVWAFIAGVLGVCALIVIMGKKRSKQNDD
ncbi:MAG: lamin tail domain-containing protein [Candidatus Bathyarchaeales archaeon]